MFSLLRIRRNFLNLFKQSAQNALAEAKALKDLLERF
jgi:hypothetical protein